MAFPMCQCPHPTLALTERCPGPCPPLPRQGNPRWVTPQLGLGGLANPVQSKQGCAGILPAALSREEGAFPCLLDTLSCWNPLKGQCWCLADGAKPVKPYFCWKAQRPWLLHTSLLSGRQTQPLPSTDLSNSAPVLLALLVSCRHCACRAPWCSGRGN